MRDDSEAERHAEFGHVAVDDADDESRRERVRGEFGDRPVHGEVHVREAVADGVGGEAEQEAEERKQDSLQQEEENQIIIDENQSGKGSSNP